MTSALPVPPFLLITDRAGAARPLDVVVAQAIQGGCRWIMLREKDLDAAAQTALAARIVALAGPAGARVVVNGDIDAAAESGAHGVHLQSAAAVEAARSRLGPGALIGFSAHGVEEARAAVASGADYVTLSPVFATESKPGYGPQLGIAGLRTACAALAAPVIALAGIGPENARDCIEAGAAGVAAMGGIMRARDPETAVRRMIEAIL